MPSLDNYANVRNAVRLGAEDLFIPIHGQEGGHKGGPVSSKFFEQQKQEY